MSIFSYVYWIYDRSCSDISVHGYIGVSDHPIKRHKQHIKLEHVPVDSQILILFQGSRKDCFDIEYVWRSKKGMGWNSAVGGRQGYRVGYVGKPWGHHTEQSKQKIREANKGKAKTAEHCSKLRESKKNISLETRIRMSVSAKARCTPEWNEKHSALMRLAKGKGSYQR